MGKKHDSQYANFGWLQQGIIKQENGHAGLSSKDYLETVNSDIVISLSAISSLFVYPLKNNLTHFM